MLYIIKALYDNVIYTETVENVLRNEDVTRKCHEMMIFNLNRIRMLCEVKYINQCILQ